MPRTMTESTILLGGLILAIGVQLLYVDAGFPLIAAVSRPLEFQVQWYRSAAAPQFAAPKGQTGAGESPPPLAPPSA